jgi:ribonuclease PH
MSTNRDPKQRAQTIKRALDMMLNPAVSDEAIGEKHVWLSQENIQKLRDVLRQDDGGYKPAAKRSVLRGVESVN